MQQALEQASAAIDAAVATYAGEIGTMRQEIAAKQAAMDQEMAARKAEVASMQAALTQHEAHYNTISALRAGAAAPASQPVPVSVVGDAPASAGGPRPGGMAVPAADRVLTAVQAGMTGPVPMPAAAVGAS